MKKFKLSFSLILRRLIHLEVMNYSEKICENNTLFV